MTDNNDNNHPPSAPPPGAVPGPPPVAHTLIIQLHTDGKISVNFPTDMKVMTKMLGDFIHLLGGCTKFEPPSAIVKAPPGLIIPPHGGRG